MEWWNGFFTNRKAVNRDTLSPGWRSVENYLSLLLIKLQFVFLHPVFVFKVHDNKTQHSPSLSAQTHVPSIGMSGAQNHRQKMVIDAELLIEFRQLSDGERREEGTPRPFRLRPSPVTLSVLSSSFFCLLAQSSATRNYLHASQPITDYCMCIDSLFLKQVNHPILSVQKLLLN